LSTINGNFWKKAYLKLNLGLGDVLLATTAAGNLLGLGDLVSDGLYILSASEHLRSFQHMHTSALKSSRG
jgi:hypothetical protein